MSWEQQGYEGYGGYGAGHEGYAGQGTGQQDSFYGGGQQQQAWGSQQQFQGAGGGAGGGPQTLNFGGASLPLDPMVTNMALNVGAEALKEKRKEVEGLVDKYISIGQLKYYFAVDNTYVIQKLRLILFPFLHSDWSIRYSHDEPVQPRYELNAADLYIPSMGLLSFLLLTGYVLGIQDRFSPEVLATTASSAVTCLVLELVLLYLATSILAINSSLCKWDLIAFSSYKYVPMIACLLAQLLGKSAYYSCLAYTAAALALFLFRTLHLRVEPSVHGVEQHGKRKLWLLSLMVSMQPLVMWWLTYSLQPSYPTLPEEKELPI